jgi:hypothetical protein
LNNCVQRVFRIVFARGGAVELLVLADTSKGDRRTPATAALPRIAVWCGSNLPTALISRVLPSEGRGREFESRRVRQFRKLNQ